MTSNDANGVAPADRPRYDATDAAGKAPEPAAIDRQGDLDRPRRPPDGPGSSDVWWMALVGAMLVFSAFPLANLFLGLPTKDYGLWYQVGLAVRQGLDIYPRPETHRLFPFMYPPSAAAMLAWLSMLGPAGSLLALRAGELGRVGGLHWAVGLAGDWLSSATTSSGCDRSVALRHRAGLQHLLAGSAQPAAPGTSVGVVCLPSAGRPIGAGALLATAAAIKAFPILVLGYLIYRRMWTASVATVAVLAAWLLVAPLPFRTPAQAVDDLVVWSQGMLFTYNTTGSPSARFGRTATRTSRSWRWRTACFATCRPMASRSCRNEPASPARGL